LFHETVQENNGEISYGTAITPWQGATNQPFVPTEFFL